MHSPMPARRTPGRDAHRAKHETSGTGTRRHTALDSWWAYQSPPPATPSATPRHLHSLRIRHPHTLAHSRTGFNSSVCAMVASGTHRDSARCPTHGCACSRSEPMPSVNCVRDPRGHAAVASQRGSPDPSATLGTHVARALQEHGAGTYGAASGTPNGVSVSPPRREPARKARSRLPVPTQSDLRSRVLLARPRDVSPGPRAPARQRGVLGAEARPHQGARCATSRGARRRRLVHARRVGVRVAGRGGAARTHQRLPRRVAVKKLIARRSRCSGWWASSLRLRTPSHPRTGAMQSARARHAWPPGRMGTARLLDRGTERLTSHADDYSVQRERTTHAPPKDA